VYVSHDLGAVARVCSRVVVMDAGEIVADGAARQVRRAPVHPYARALIAAIPRIDRAQLPCPPEGRPRQPGGQEAGCAFAPRCELAAAACRAAPIALLPGPGRRAGALPAGRGGRSAACAIAWDAADGQLDR
jgi:peptide/nickel transport system ATP-binding protein